MFCHDKVQQISFCGRTTSNASQEQLSPIVGHQNEIFDWKTVSHIIPQRFCMENEFTGRLGETINVNLMYLAIYDETCGDYGPTEGQKLK